MPVSPPACWPTRQSLVPVYRTDYAAGTGQTTEAYVNALNGTNWQGQTLAGNGTETQLNRYNLGGQMMEQIVFKSDGTPHYKVNYEPVTPLFGNFYPGLGFVQPGRQVMSWRDYFGRDETLNDDETSRRFAQRHRLGLWCGVLPFFGFFANLWLFIKLDGNPLAFACGWFFGLTLLVYIGAVYRCPRCGTVPSSSVPGTTGVLLFPKKCPKCKAPLLPQHPRAQE